MVDDLEQESHVPLAGDLPQGRRVEPADQPFNQSRVVGLSAFRPVAERPVATGGHQSQKAVHLAFDPHRVSDAFQHVHQPGLRVFADVEELVEPTGDDMAVLAQKQASRGRRVLVPLMPGERAACEIAGVDAQLARDRFDPDGRRGLHRIQEGRLPVEGRVPCRVLVAQIRFRHPVGLGAGPVAFQQFGQGEAECLVFDSRPMPGGDTCQSVGSARVEVLRVHDDITIPGQEPVDHEIRRVDDGPGVLPAGAGVPCLEASGGHAAQRVETDDGGLVRVGGGPRAFATARQAAQNGQHRHATPPLTRRVSAVSGTGFSPHASTPTLI